MKVSQSKQRLENAFQELTDTWHLFKTKQKNKDESLRVETEIGEKKKVEASVEHCPKHWTKC